MLQLLMFLYNTHFLDYPTCYWNNKLKTVILKIYCFVKKKILCVYYFGKAVFVPKFTLCDLTANKLLVNIIV